MNIFSAISVNGIADKLLDFKMGFPQNGANMPRKYNENQIKEALEHLEKWDGCIGKVSSAIGGWPGILRFVPFPRRAADQPFLGHFLGKAKARPKWVLVFLYCLAVCFLPLIRAFRIIPSRPSSSVMCKSGLFRKKLGRQPSIIRLSKNLLCFVKKSYHSLKDSRECAESCVNDSRKTFEF